MKRKEKYPDTDTFRWYNANPKGRITGDCTFRAIATVTEKSWETVVMEMAEMSCRTGYAINDKKGIERYMKEQGWEKQKQPRHGDGTKYTGEEFCIELSVNERKEYGNVLCKIGSHHVVAIVPTCEGDGINDRFKICDIWDSTGGRVGNYWIKPKQCGGNKN